jgi:hypothetical protein
MAGAWTCTTRRRLVTSNTCANSIAIGSWWCWPRPGSSPGGALPGRDRAAPGELVCPVPQSAGGQLVERP